MSAIITFEMCSVCGSVYLPMFAIRPAKVCPCGGDIVGTTEAAKRKDFEREVAYRADKYSDWKPDPL